MPAFQYSITTAAAVISVAGFYVSYQGEEQVRAPLA